MKRFGCKVLLLLGGMFVLGGNCTGSIFAFFLFYGRHKCTFAIEPGFAAYKGVF